MKRIRSLLALICILALVLTGCAAPQAGKPLTPKGALAFGKGASGWRAPCKAVGYARIPMREGASQAEIFAFSNNNCI